MKRGFNELEKEKTQKNIVGHLQKLRPSEKSNSKSPQKILEENIKNVDINDKKSPKIEILIEASQENNNEVALILNKIKMRIFTLLIRYYRKKHQENQVMRPVKKKIFIRYIKNFSLIFRNFGGRNKGNRNNYIGNGRKRNHYNDSYRLFQCSVL